MYIDYLDTYVRDYAKAYAWDNEMTYVWDYIISILPHGFPSFPPSPARAPPRVYININPSLAFP